MDKSIVSANQLAVRSSSVYEFSNSNPAEVVEIEDDDASVENVERQFEDLKLDYQFNENDVPQIFKTLINGKLDNLEKIEVVYNDEFCLMMFDDTGVYLDKIGNDWLLSYNDDQETIKADDLKKLIVDHLWVVLNNPCIKLNDFAICAYESLRSKFSQNPQKMDVEKLSALLQSMVDSINHPIHTKRLQCEGFDEDTLLSMLKHVKPGTLEYIRFNISWKEEENYQKMKEIVETVQWEQAKEIYSSGVTPLKIDNLFQFERFRLKLESVTPKDVLRVTEHVFNSAGNKNCCLSSGNKDVDIDAIINFLRSQNDGAEVTEINSNVVVYYSQFKIVKSSKCVLLFGNVIQITIRSL